MSRLCSALGHRHRQKHSQEHVVGVSSRNQQFLKQACVAEMTVRVVSMRVRRTILVVVVGCVVIGFGCVFEKR